MKSIFIILICIASFFTTSCKYYYAEAKVPMGVTAKETYLKDRAQHGKRFYVHYDNKVAHLSSIHFSKEHAINAVMDKLITGKGAEEFDGVRRQHSGSTKAGDVHLFVRDFDNQAALEAPESREEDFFIYLTDDKRDGWNESVLSVYLDSLLLDSALTLETSKDFKKFNFRARANQEITLFYKAGKNANENNIQVFGTSSNEVVPIYSVISQQPDSVMKIRIPEMFFQSKPKLNKDEQIVSIKMENITDIIDIKRDKFNTILAYTLSTIGIAFVVVFGSLAIMLSDW